LPLPEHCKAQKLTKTMKTILVAGNSGRSRALSLGRWTRALLSIGVLGLPLSAGVALGYAMGGHQQPNALEDEVGDALRQQMRGQERHTSYDENSNAGELAVRMADLQTRLVRLDALGGGVSGLAELDGGEFEVIRPRALGGPSLSAPIPAPATGALHSVIDRLARQIDGREQQFSILEELLTDRKVERDVAFGGAPVRKGWISSRFGWRTDPFTGRRSMHEGVDFAAPAGSAIVAVAAGVVTWAGTRNGYGKMVEIDHGGDYATGYAHSKQLLVKAGDVVRKGQIIALMGNTGRSTGPHVHFEVYKHGRPVDPTTYIHQASR
jgi:murein DD-endopeptidase MepM/ murein hydrolase activator NlpD